MVVIRGKTLYLISGVGIVSLVIFFLLMGSGQDFPEIYVANEMIDLGVFDKSQLHQDPNKPKYVRFKIENRGTGVLKMTRILVSCSCLEPRLSREILLPGEVAQLSVRITVPIRSGEFRERILLSSNDENNPVKELVVKGFVHRPCYVLPESIVVNGLNIGEKRCIELEVTGPANDKSFTIGEVSTTTNALQTQEIVNNGIRSETGRAIWRITLTVASRGLLTWEDKIRIPTNNQESPLLEVSVKVRELPPVKVEPAIVIFKRPIETKHVVVTSNIPTPITILDIVKPDWLDMKIDPDINRLPVKLLKLRDFLRSDFRGLIFSKRTPCV